MKVNQNMPARTASPAFEQGSGGVSIRHPLMLAVNLAVVLSLAAFFAWEYVHTRATLLQEKRIALREEAETLLPAVGDYLASPQRLQQYIDAVCVRMRDSSSPGHHIVVRAGDAVFQARAHHRQSEALLQAVEQAAQREGGTMSFDEEQVIAASASEGAVTVYVSEYLSNIRRMLHALLARRALSILMLAAILALLINILIHRLATRPINRFVAAVRQIRSGRLGVQTPMPRIAELRYLAGEFNTMSTALEQADRRRRAQMDKARRIQANLIPRREAVRPHGIDFLYEPAEDVGGDFFDVRAADNGACFVYLADVSGHGVPAALGAAMLKTLFDTQMTPRGTPDAIVTRVHEAFAAATLDEDFATAFVLRWSPEDGILHYTSAGHGPAFLLSSEGEIEELDATGPLMGADLGGRWETRERAPNAARLVVVTDGVQDLQSETGEAFGADRLRAVLRDTIALPLGDALSQLHNTLVAFRGKGHQTDDMTVLAINLQEGRS